jgi:hypothetical protein
MNRIAALFGLILPLASVAAPRLEYVTYGVMLHWNFSENEFKAFSYGVEASYWNFEKDNGESYWEGVQPNLKKPGYGLDVGAELDFKNLRLYAEPQVGLVLAGVSAGPVLEIPKGGGNPRLGSQASGWVGMLALADFRYRRMDGKNIQAVGLSGKLGTLISDRAATLNAE